MVVAVLSREKLFHGLDIILCPFVTECTVLPGEVSQYLTPKPRASLLATAALTTRLRTRSVLFATRMTAWSPSTPASDSDLRITSAWGTLTWWSPETGHLLQRGLVVHSQDYDESIGVTVYDLLFHLEVKIW